MLQQWKKAPLLTETVDFSLFTTCCIWKIVLAIFGIELRSLLESSEDFKSVYPFFQYGSASSWPHIFFLFIYLLLFFVAFLSFLLQCEFNINVCTQILLHIFIPYDAQGPVVKIIVSLTSSLRAQLFKCFMTLWLFALQKLLTFFQQKYWRI